MPQKPLAKTVFVIAVIILIALNLATLIAAYPETYTPSSGISSGPNLAKDFSAYYVGAWRLWNKPTQIYTHGVLGGSEPVTPPQPETYKYMPNFLLVATPFLGLSYQQALLAFDVVQFLLLPAIAFMLYRILKGKHLAVTFAVMAIALLLPFPAPNGGLSLSYYWQWGEGQAKVILIFLLLLSFYLGSRGKPVQSGIAFAFGFFDPRFGLLAIPLFIMYNRGKLKAAAASGIVALAASNAMLLYPGLDTGFLGMVFGSGLTTPLYYYALIPLFTLLALMFVNFKELVAAFDYRGVFANYTGAKIEK
jgi:hypothetical protein